MLDEDNEPGLIILATYQLDGVTAHLIVQEGDVDLARDLNQALTVNPMLRLVKTPQAAKAS